MNENGLLKFLYEDNHVLVVEKPPGLLSQKDSSGDLDLLTIAKAIIKVRDKKPGNVFLGLVHRLDRPVGGVMILAKTSKGAARLSKQFRERTMIKIYHATVEGCPEVRRGELRNILVKDKKSGMARIAGEDENGSKEGVLKYNVLASKPGKSLIELELVTGLPHQIRVQLAAKGHPVFGDRKYGSKIYLLNGHIALYSKSITFGHPTTGEQIVVTCNPPEFWPW